MVFTFLTAPFTLQPSIPGPEPGYYSAKPRRD